MHDHFLACWSKKIDQKMEINSCNFNHPKFSIHYLTSQILTPFSYMWVLVSKNLASEKMNMNNLNLFDNHPTSSNLPFKTCDTLIDEILVHWEYTWLEICYHVERRGIKRTFAKRNVIFHNNLLCNKCKLPRGCITYPDISA